MPLTEQQQQVIENPNENKLVCALPGSGKTFTMTELANVITQDNTAFVLMVTFTNAACQEMSKRIKQRLSPHQSRRVVVRTFAKIMIEQFKQFRDHRRIIMGPELTNYIHRVARDRGIEPDYYAELEQTIELIGRLRESDMSNHECFGIYLQVQKLLKDSGRIDLQCMAREVTQGVNAKTISPMPYTHFLVDEFQDTDSSQYEWLLAHKLKSNYFTVVGDDDQSIFGWRGAEGYNNMVLFQKDFEAKGYLLGTCFRCAPNILTAAQRLIEHNTHRIPKVMRSNKSASGKVFVSQMPKSYTSPFTTLLRETQPDYNDKVPPFMKKLRIDNYRYVVDTIAERCEDLAILGRTNLQLDALEFCLSERGIPALRIGGRSIFDDPNVIGYAQFVTGFVSPKHRQSLIDGLAWMGIEEKLLRVIRDSRTNQNPLFDLAETSNLAIVRDLSQLFNDSMHTKPAVAEICKKLFDLMSRQFTYQNDPFINRRLAGVSIIHSILTKTNDTFARRVHELNNMLSRVGTKSIGDYHPSDKVVLCTMTSAKGLEWKNVYLMMLNETVIPSPKINAEDLCALEEERRLLYVAMTRAEETLTLNYTVDEPSEFLENIGVE